MLKLAGSLPEAVPPQHSGNHRPFQEPWPAHVSLDIPPQNHSTSTSGNWDRGTDPTAFPTGTAKDETEALCVQKTTTKKKRQKPDKLRNRHILLLQGGRCFTTRHLRRKCGHCPAVLGSILTWDPTAQSSSNTSPKAGSSAPNQPELHKPGQTGHFSLPVHLQARHWGSTSYGCLGTLHKWVKCIKRDFPGKRWLPLDP